MRPFSAGDRRVRLLQALTRDAGGLTLAEAVAAIGEVGRQANRATVVMLRHLRNEGLVGYVPAAAGEELSRGGQYCLTPDGLDWLETHGFTPQDECEIPVPTGAMHGEAGAAFWTRAEPGQAPAGAIASVFDLARRCAS